MRKWLMAIPVILVLFSLVALAGCGGGGVAQEDYDQVKAQLTTVQAELDTLKAQQSGSTGGDTAKLAKELSTISAYVLWFDYYYPENALVQTNDAFIERLGTLVAAIGDANTLAAYNVYYQAEASYRQVLAGLPTDSNIWTKEQYDSWVAAGEARATALGQVGGYLDPLFKAVSWFNPS
jgi:hypothetical protein